MSGRWIAKRWMCGKGREEGQYIIKRKIRLSCWSTADWTNKCELHCQWESCRLLLALREWAFTFTTIMVVDVDMN